MVARRKQCSMRRRPDMCGSGCKDLSADQQNCGTCGNACGTGQTCQGGQCLCSAGLLACGGNCVASDASHCGSCSTTCAGGQVCANNACAASCPAGQTMCRAAPASDAWQRASLRRLQPLSCRVGVQRRRLRLPERRADAVRERVRRHQDQQGSLRRLRPALRTARARTAVARHPGRHDAAAAERPPHDQRRVRRLRAGAARDDADAEHDNFPPDARQTAASR